MAFTEFKATRKIQGWKVRSDYTTNQTSEMTKSTTLQMLKSGITLHWCLQVWNPRNLIKHMTATTVTKENLFCTVQNKATCTMSGSVYKDVKTTARDGKLAKTINYERLGSRQWIVAISSYLSDQWICNTDAYKLLRWLQTTPSTDLMSLAYSPRDQTSKQVASRRSLCTSPSPKSHYT